MCLSHEESFTAVFFTTPEKALKEVVDSGFEVISRAGAESFLSGLNTQLFQLKSQQETNYQHFIEKACDYCELPAYRDATEHLTIIAKK